MLRIDCEEKKARYDDKVLFTDNFNLFFGSKNPNKTCDINVPKSRENPNIDCHDEQAIVECFLTHNNHPDINKPISLNSLLGYPFLNDGANYLLGNFGIVMSDKEYKKQGDHKRIFLSAPICYPSAHVYPCEEDVHSEGLLLKCFLQKENNALNTENIKLLFSNVEKGRMIYSLIFDLHSSRDVCNKCIQSIYQFQEMHTDNFMNCLFEFGFHLPEDRSKFKIVFRISATSKFETYHGGAHPDLDKPLDISSSNIPSIFHSNEDMRKKLWRWYNKDNYVNLNKLILNNYTLFTNQRGKSKGIAETNKVLNNPIEISTVAFSAK